MTATIRTACSRRLTSSRRFTPRVRSTFGARAVCSCRLHAVQKHRTTAPDQRRLGSGHRGRGARSVDAHKTGDRAGCDEDRADARARVCVLRSFVCHAAGRHLHGPAERLKRRPSSRGRVDGVGCHPHAIAATQHTLDRHETPSTRRHRRSTAPTRAPLVKRSRRTATWPRDIRTCGACARRSGKSCACYRRLSRSAASRKRLLDSSPSPSCLLYWNPCSRTTRRPTSETAGTCISATGSSSDSQFEAARRHVRCTRWRRALERQVELCMCTIRTEDRRPPGACMCTRYTCEMLILSTCKGTVYQLV